MTLICYLDDSGKDAQNPITTIAGYVATAEAWAEYEAAVEPIFARYGVFGNSGERVQPRAAPMLSSAIDSKSDDRTTSQEQMKKGPREAAPLLKRCSVLYATAMIERREVRNAAPIAPTPSSIIAQVAGSGTAGPPPPRVPPVAKNDEPLAKPKPPSKREAGSDFIRL
jgi:hypothetical protein